MSEAAPVAAANGPGRAPGRFAFAVVVPCFDEETRIGRTIEELHARLDALVPDGWQVIVVDDHSVDRTAHLVQQTVGSDPRFQLVVTERGKGKGAAVRTGILVASADEVLVVDADLAADLDVIPALRRRLEEAPAVLGSRVAPGASVQPARPLVRRVAALLFRRAARAITGVRAADPQCGCKLFRRSVVLPHVQRLTTEGYAYEVELLMRLRAAGLSTVDHPVSWHEGPDSKIRVASDGLAMLRDVLRLRRELR